MMALPILNNVSARNGWVLLLTSVTLPNLCPYKWVYLPRDSDGKVMWQVIVWPKCVGDLKYANLILAFHVTALSSLFILPYIVTHYIIAVFVYLPLSIPYLGSAFLTL